MSRAPLLLALAGACVFLNGCASSSLESLRIEGPELHELVRTLTLEEAKRIHIRPELLVSNPQFSTDPEFIETIGRGSSQGRYDGAGAVSALYALYHGEGTLGIYALEAESMEEADRIEGLRREVWAHNASLDVARVHREGKFIAVVFAHPKSPSYWEAVNAVVDARMDGL